MLQGCHHILKTWRNSFRSWFRPQEASSFWVFILAIFFFSSLFHRKVSIAKKSIMWSWFECAMDSHCVRMERCPFSPNEANSSTKRSRLWKRAFQPQVSTVLFCNKSSPLKSLLACQMVFKDIFSNGFLFLPENFLLWQCQCFNTGYLRHILSLACRINCKYYF